VHPSLYLTQTISMNKKMSVPTWTAIMLKKNREYNEIQTKFV